MGLATQPRCRTCFLRGLPWLRGPVKRANRRSTRELRGLNERQRRASRLLDLVGSTRRRIRRGGLLRERRPQLGKQRETLTVRQLEAATLLSQGSSWSTRRRYRVWGSSEKQSSDFSENVHVKKVGRETRGRLFKRCCCSPNRVWGDPVTNCFQRSAGLCFSPMILSA